MDEHLTVKLIKYLQNFVTTERYETLVHTLNKRTDYLTVVLEDIYQPHNASAVLRSCDGFGVQTVHVIENNSEFDASSQVTIGADRWLDIIRYNEPAHDNTTVCINVLRAQGYQIVATTPHEEVKNIHELDISKPTALVFGNELDGISSQVKELADGFVSIPMYGFSESFNISVSAAVCLYDLTMRLREGESDIQWQLDENYKNKVLLKWLKNSIKAGEQLAEKYLSDFERGEVI